MRIRDSIYLWMIPFNLNKLPNTELEKHYANDLNLKIAERYLYSRSHIRESLAPLLNLDPLLIPLVALPNKPPFLEQNLGYLSISHCNDIILLGWSENPIGVDIERSDRNISGKLLLEKYFLDNKNFLTNFKGEIIKSKILDYWLIKESVIKLKKGNLFLELKDWDFDEKNFKSINKNSGEIIESKNFKIDSWTIGIANKNISSRNKILVCKQ